MGEAKPDGGLSDAAGRRAVGRLAARSALKRLLSNQAGATAIEYGLIVSLIFLVIVGAVSSFGHNTTNIMNAVSANVASAM